MNTDQEESVSLAFNDLDRGGGSDKVYLLSLTKEPEGWKVVAQYGPRVGRALQSQVKCEGALYAKAKKTYDKVAREKLSGGYLIQGAPVAPPVAPSGAAIEADILPPELLEEVQDALPFVRDPAYWMQDKSDGVSRGVVKANGEIFGINKRGLPVPLEAKLVEALALLPFQKFQIDAELVGLRLVCRDLLIANVDVSQMPYEWRYESLRDLIAHNIPCEEFGHLIALVANWTEPTEKAIQLEVSKKERREGVVFKLRGAPYKPGRNGQHKKYKFIKTLSAIAGPPKSNGKESVELFLYDEAKKLARCGTVSLIGKAKVNEGDIIEAAYLYAQPSGLMTQARMLCVRNDVPAEECTTKQLIFKREDEPELTIAGSMVSVSELAQIIEAGQEGGMGAALGKYEEIKS